ncbi:MAG: lectin-like protein [Planctomycetaceae bacterium]
MATYDPETGSVTWNDDKNGQDSLGKHTEYVLFERPRYVLKSKPSAHFADAAEDADSHGQWLATIGSDADNEAILNLLKAEQAKPENAGTTVSAWIGGQLQTGIVGLTNKNSYRVEVLSDQDYNNFGVTPLSPTISSTIVGKTSHHEYLSMQAPEANGKLTAVDGTTTQYYVLAKTDPSGTTTYSLRNDTKRTFAEAMQDATSQKGWVAFVQDNVNRDFNTARKDNDVWLNASDSAGEGTWRYASGMSGHAQSIRLLDPVSGEVMPITAPTGGAYTFTLTRAENGAIAGLKNFETYQVSKIDDNRFQLLAPAADGSLQPVVLPTPTDPTGGKGSYLGTLGIDLKKPGTGTHRLVLDLSTAPSSQTQTLQLVSAGSAPTSVGTGTASATGSALAVGAVSFAFLDTTATGQPHTHVTLADTVQLTADEGEIDIQAEAFGNGSSSARAKAYGIVAVANSNAQTTLGQTAQVTLLGHLQASTISIDAHIAGRGMNRSTAAAGGLAPLATANGNLDLDNAAQAKVQIGQADPANLTRLKSETDLAITSRFAGFMADVKTLSQSSGAFGNCRTNWNDGFTTAVHLGGDSPTALIIVENARLRVEDLHGRLSLESSIAGVDVDLTTKAYATGLLANLAKAEIDGGLKAQVALDENAWLRAATIALAAYETLQKWLAEAEIRRNGGRSDAKATINNDGAVQVSAGSTAWLQTNHLQVDVRQFESRDPHGVWQPNSENATYFQTVSSSVHQKNKSDNLSATTTLDLSETIGWDPDATVEGMGQARLVIRPDGSVDSTQTLGSLDWTATSDTVTIHGVKSYDGTVDIDFGWTTNPWIEATTTKQGEDPLRGTVTLPPATPVTNMTITAGPVVTVINQSDRHLAIDSLDLLQATGTADVTLTNNGTDTNMTANLDGDFSRLTIDNEAAGRDVRLNGNLSAREVRLESQRNLDPAKFVTLSSREFLLDAGGTVGHGVTTPPTNPQILLQSWGGPDVASVKASAGQDLSLQVRFAPDSDGDVTQLQQFSAQQLYVRLLPWTSNSQEQTTNYQVQLEALSSTIPNRIVSLTGNMQPAADWSEATALSPTSVHLDVSGWVSNQPYPPILLVEATGNIDTGVVSSAGAPTSVSRVTSIFGDVTLSSPGDLTIGQLVSSPKTVTWAGAGALRSAQPGTPVIQANQLHLGGPGGLGSATRSLPTQVTWLTGTPDSASGALYVLNTDAGLGLHLDDVTVGTGNLQVITSGTLTVAGPVANTGGGNIAMAANGTGAGYQFVGGNWTYSQAQANAAAHQGTLASPVTPDQNRLFAELLAQAPNGPQAAWLAGDNLANSQLLSWTLPNGSQSAFFSLPTATPFDLAPPAVTRPSVSFWRSGAVVSGRYANWAANEPNNFGGQENHAVMKGDGTWNDKNRESPQVYVLFVPEQNSYTLISDRTRTFTEAVMDARSRGGYVARVADAAEQQAVKSAAQGNDVWLNQSDEGHEGDWQYADLPARFFYTNWAGSQPGYQPAGRSNWAVGEPNNWSGNEDNAVLNADGTWNDIAGTAKFPYVLYLRGTYTLMSTAVTFADAKADAQRKGGFVASVVTSDDQVKIKAAANGKTVWINNTDAAREGEWLAFDYVTQQYANFSNWAANEPNNFNGQENYAVMSATGRWNDVAGTEQHGYVLYQPATGAYSYQAGPFTFAAALQDAAAKNGYMAHVTSGAEQTAVALAAGITPVGYSHWAVNEPNNANGNEDNAIMDTDGTWVDVPGSETHNYVLYKEGTYSYQHRLKKFTFAEAKADAQQQGGVVASVITSADQANVKNAANGNKVWINNTDAVNEGEWLAYDSSSKSYGFFSNWAAGEPNNSGGAEDNAVMTATGKWNDVKGTNTYGYVLYLPTTGAYSYQAGPFTFANAVADAQNKRGFVAGVTNVTEQAAVKAAANGNVVWLNATDAGLEGDWRRTKVVWLNATDDGTEGRWRVGTYGSTLNGAVMDYGGTWREEPVNQKHGYALYTPQDNKYTLQETPRTLAEARTHAASLGGVIARITTEAEQNRIRDLNGGVIWINLTDEASEGTWVAPGPTAASLPANAYRNWASQQPANALQSDNVVMEADGTWKTEWPSANYAYVLYTPADGKYTRIDGSFTFLQAQADAFHRGGYVAKVTTASEQTAVQTAAAGQTIWLNAWNDGQDYWRMLPDYPHATPGAFVQWAENFGWSHPRDWANGTPRVVQLQADGTWTLRGTTSTSGYLLQTRPGSLFVNSTIEATGGNGNINLVGQGDIRVGGAGGLDATIHSAGAGQIAIGPGTRYSDGQVHNGSGQAQLSMTPGSKITSDTGTIALLATGSIGLSQVKTGGSALIVADYNGVEGNLPDGTGAITVPAANAVNPIQVTAARAIFAAEGVVAGAGVGQVTTPIQIDVDTVAATTDKGDLALVNHGPLVLGSVDIQLTGLLAQVLKWKDVAPVTQLPGWLSQWFQHRQQTAPLIATANGHFVMGGAAILDQDNGGVATGSLSIETRNGNLTVRDNVPVINLDAGLLKLAAVSGTEEASLVIPDTTRLYTEGGTGLLVLHEGDAANPADLPVPEATCDLYHQLDTLGELTQGQQAWLKLAKCPDPAPLLRASFAPLGLLGSAPVGLLGGEAPALLGATSVSDPVFC